MNAPATPDSREDFAALYSGCHLQLLRYVLTLLPDRHLAEDVVQEAARCLWRKFDDYDPARPFWPWARQFAYLEVLKVRKRLAVRARYFSDDAVELIAAECDAHEEVLASRRVALGDCVAKLDAPSRELILSRYRREGTLQDIAHEQGRSANALYLTLYRIRRRLLECVNGALREEGGA